MNDICIVDSYAAKCQTYIDTFNVQIWNRQHKHCIQYDYECPTQKTQTFRIQFVVVHCSCLKMLAAFKKRAVFRKNRQTIWISILLIILLPLIVLFCAPFEQPIPTLKPVTHGNISWCYKPRVHSSIRYFDDISDAQKQPTRGKSVFFHETTCISNGIVKLNSK